MLPLKFCKMSLDRHMIHRFVSSDAKAYRTLDWEIPNCRAIRDSVMPALNILVLHIQESKSRQIIDLTARGRLNHH
jgi:hypothetical protein